MIRCEEWEAFARALGEVHRVLAEPTSGSVYADVRTLWRARERWERVRTAYHWMISDGLLG